MIHLLLGCSDPASMIPFQAAMNDNGVRTTRLEMGYQILAKISEEHVDLLVVDEALDDTTGLALIRAVIERQPMLNCAAISSLSAEDFHEKSEGLGVLMQLPVNPGRKAAEQLLQHFKKIQAFTTAAAPDGVVKP